jgi:hypothetical protein
MVIQQKDMRYVYHNQDIREREKQWQWQWQQEEEYHQDDGRDEKIFDAENEKFSFLLDEFVE